MSNNQPASPGRVIVMTGATSGIGRAALERLAGRENDLVVVGARGIDRDVPAGVEVLPLDLTSLDSVRAFAAAVIERLGASQIDALVLNAGTQSRDVNRRTADGFEVAFGVNHLAHYLLARLLEPHLAAKGRLILTTSDTHDPSITPLGPKSIDPEQLAEPTKAHFGAGMRAYTASKLCNLLTARSHADSATVRDRGMTVVAYNPGFTGGTNLGDPTRGQERFMRSVVFPIFRIVGRFKPAFAIGSPERAGEVLALLATGEVAPPTGQVYVSLVRGEITFPEPSQLAQDDAVRDDLWARSERMVGLV